jgi:hypothetical protein
MEGGVPEEVAVSEAEKVEKTKLPEGVKKLRDASEKADKAGAQEALTTATGEASGQMMKPETALRALGEIDQKRKRDTITQALKHEVVSFKHMAAGRSKKEEKGGLLTFLKRGQEAPEAPVEIKKAELAPWMVDELRETNNILQAAPGLAGEMVAYYGRREEIEEMADKLIDSVRPEKDKSRGAKLAKGGVESKPKMVVVKDPDMARLVDFELNNGFGVAQLNEALNSEVANSIVESVAYQTVAKKEKGKFTGAQREAMEDRVFGEIFGGADDRSRRKIRANLEQMSRRHADGRTGQLPLTTLIDDEAFDVGITEFKDLARIAGEAAKAQLIVRITPAKSIEGEMEGQDEYGSEKIIKGAHEGIIRHRYEVNQDGEFGLHNEEGKWEKRNLPKAQEDRYWRMIGVKKLAEQMEASMAAYETKRKVETYSAGATRGREEVGEVGEGETPKAPVAKGEGRQERQEPEVSEPRVEAKMSEEVGKFVPEVALKFLKSRDSLDGVIGFDERKEHSWGEMMKQGPDYLKNKFSELRKNNAAFEIAKQDFMLLATVFRKGGMLQQQAARTAIECELAYWQTALSKEQKSQKDPEENPKFRIALTTHGLRHAYQKYPDMVESGAEDLVNTIGEALEAGEKK